MVRPVFKVSRTGALLLIVSGIEGGKELSDVFSASLVREHFVAEAADDFETAIEKKTISGKMFSPYGNKTKQDYSF